MTSAAAPSMDVPTTIRNLADAFVGRARSQGFKGKARDAYALEFFLGAYDATRRVLGDDAPLAKALSVFAFLISARGYSEVERRAEGAA